jgi:hypothetical protein
MDAISKFLAMVDALPEPELHQFLIQLGNRAWAGKLKAIEQLDLLYCHRIVHFCLCEPVIVPCDDPDCVEAGLESICPHSGLDWSGCTHIPADGTFFGGAAMALVLWYCHPGDYGERPGPDEVSDEIDAISHAAKVEALVHRAHRKQGLYHVKDRGNKHNQKRNWDEREQRMRRKAEHLGNGQPVKNVRLKAGEKPAKSMFEGDPRAIWLAAHGYDVTI